MSLLPRRLVVEVKIDHCLRAQAILVFYCLEQMENFRCTYELGEYVMVNLEQVLRALLCGICASKLLTRSRES